MKAPATLRRWWSAPFVRTAVWGALGLAIVMGGVALAYELALARVPQHRARLERLVRAQTGLDVRFNELNLRWGWYGPEAVFHRVELGEPGRSKVLVRAPQLIVGFDAWDSLQSGQLQAGRITFVAPDINLERGEEARPGAALHASVAQSESRTRLLQRWRGGRIEFEGGTLRLPDPAGSADALALQIRRASLRRSQTEWSASALVFLPEKLGHTARVAAQLQGDLTQPRTLEGSVRFEGLRLAFAGWRQVFGPQSPITRRLPNSGNGDVSFRANFDHDGVAKADGRVRAQEVRFNGAPWFFSATTEGPVDQGLTLPRLRGDWRLVHRDADWQLRVERLDLGAQREGDSFPDLAVDVRAGGAQVDGTLGDIPLASLLSVASWFAPHVDFAGIALEGSARDVRFDWSDARPEGSRLRATSKAKGVSFTPASRNFILDGLDVDLSASERDIDVVLNAAHGKLTMAHSPQQPLEELRIASDLRLSPQGEGWHLTTPLLTVDHDATQLILSGSLTARQPTAAPMLDMRATLVRADVQMLQDLLREDAVKQFGGVVTQLSAGRIERAQFQLQTQLGNDAPEAESPPRLFSGTLALRDGKVAAGELWPEASGLDARLDWAGERMSVTVERGRTGSIEVESAQARWSVARQRTLQFSGQVRGRLEDALHWLAAHPKLEEYTPRLRDFSASGDARFSFDVSPRAAARGTEPAVRVQVAALLEGAQLHVARDVPPIRSVRGSLAFEAGRLQRSTLTGRWLGGPVNLRVSERRDRHDVALVVQAQGLLDARQLVALTGSEPLPEVVGETPWFGELTYAPADGARPAQWQLDADASLIGVSSRLPEPLAKAVVTAVPLRVEASGNAREAQVNITLGNRLRSQLALQREAGVDGDPRWRVERGAVNFGAGAVRVPNEAVMAIHGELDRFDLPGYAALWRRVGNLANVSAIVADLVAQQLWIAGRAFPEVRVQARKVAGAAPELSLESPELKGSVRWPAHGAEVRLSAQSLDAVERARIVAQLEDTWHDSTVTVN